MKNYTQKHALAQRGMTLIELTVVLLILIGLAGLLLPYVSGFFQKTQTSSAADSLAEVNKAIDRYETQYLAYPDSFDTLNDGSATGVITWLAGVGNTNVVSPNLQTLTMNTDIVTSLNSANINTLRPMRTDTTATDFNATFNNSLPSANLGITAAAAIPANGTTPATLATINQLVELTPVAATTLLNTSMGVTINTTNNHYVVFGVGQHTQMSGKTLKEAPVFFGGGVDNPTARYDRYLAVFEVPRTATANAGKAAKFIGALTPTLQTPDALLQSFHADVNDTTNN